MLVVMSVLRVTLCAQVGFLLVELGERVVVALAMLAACDIGCFVHERGGNTASVEFIGGSLEETAQDIGLFGKALGFAHMDAAPALTQIHCMREQCFRLGTCGGAIGAEREVAVDLQFRIRFEGSQPEFGRDRADAGQDHDVGVHFEVFRDLIVAGEEDQPERRRTLSSRSFIVMRSVTKASQMPQQSPQRVQNSSPMRG